MERLSTDDEFRFVNLDEFSVEVTDDVRRYLLETIFNNKDDEKRLDTILNYMKQPPNVTTCRFISTDPNVVIEEIKNSLQSWLIEQPNIKLDIQVHDKLPDVLCIRVVEQQQRQLENEINDSSCSIGDNQQQENHASNNASKAIIIDRMAGEAVLRGADLFVKGVLCAEGTIQMGDKVIVYADIPLTGAIKLPRGITLQEYKKHLGINKSRIALHLASGIAMCNKSSMFRNQYGIAVRMTQQQQTKIYRLPPMNIHSNHFMLQNLPSCTVAHILLEDIIDTTTTTTESLITVIDMCSAPGGKTSHLAHLLHLKTINSILIACDKSRQKMISAQKLFQRLNEKSYPCSIVPLALDTTKCVLDNESTTDTVQQIIEEAVPSPKDGLLNVRGFLPESFDRILLDPPCSALGLRPKLSIAQKTASDLHSNVLYQRQFAKAAVQLLKPGGYMTYSTCTINGAENEGMVHYFTTSLGLELIPIRLSMGGPGLSVSNLTQEQCQAVRRFNPDSDTMGFFVAKFRKPIKN